MHAQDSRGEPLTHSGGDTDLACTASVDSTLAGQRAYMRGTLDQGLPVGQRWLQYQRGTLRGELLQPLPGGLTAWAGLRGAALVLVSGWALECMWCAAAEC